MVRYKAIDFLYHPFFSQYHTIYITITLTIPILSMPYMHTYIHAAIHTYIRVPPTHRDSSYSRPSSCLKKATQLILLLPC